MAFKPYTEAPATEAGPEVAPRSGPRFKPHAKASPERAALQAELDTRLKEADMAQGRLEATEENLAIPRAGLRLATNVVKGATMSLLLAEKVGTAPLSWATGNDYRGLVERAHEDYLSDPHLAAQTPGEELEDRITQGLAGVGTTLVGGRELAATGGKVGQAVGNFLKAQPVAQGAGAVTGSVAGQAAHEAGASPLVEFGATVLGGGAPLAGSAIANKVGQVVSNIRPSDALSAVKALPAAVRALKGSPTGFLETLRNAYKGYRTLQGRTPAAPAPAAAPPVAAVPRAAAPASRPEFDLGDLLNTSELDTILAQQVPDAPVVAPAARPQPAQLGEQLAAPPAPARSDLIDSSELEAMVAGMPETPTISADDVLINSGSGERGLSNAASVEGMRRANQEAAAGQFRYLRDTDGTLIPLTGVTSVDAVARPGQMIVQRGIGDTPYTILDAGGMSPTHARGLLARITPDLDAASAERMAAQAAPEPFPVDDGGFLVEEALPDEQFPQLGNQFVFGDETLPLNLADRASRFIDDIRMGRAVEQEEPLSPARGPYRRY